MVYFPFNASLSRHTTQEILHTAWSPRIWPRIPRIGTRSQGYLSRFPVLIYMHVGLPSVGVLPTDSLVSSLRGTPYI